MLEAGGWTGDNDADADRRMQGGSGQASARREPGCREGVKAQDVSRSPAGHPPSPPQNCWDWNRKPLLSTWRHRGRNRRETSPHPRKKGMKLGPS